MLLHGAHAVLHTDEWLDEGKSQSYKMPGKMSWILPFPKTRVIQPGPFYQFWTLGNVRTFLTQVFTPWACFIFLMLQGPVLLSSNPAGLRTSLTAHLALYLVVNSLFFLSHPIPRAITGICIKHLLVLWFDSHSYSFRKMQFISFSNPFNMLTVFYPMFAAKHYPF